RSREVLRAERRRNIDERVWSEEGAVRNCNAADDAGLVDGSPSKSFKPLDEFALIANAVRQFKDFPGAPDGQRRIPGEQAEAADLVHRRLQPEEERLAVSKRSEGPAARTPEVHLA